MDPRYIPQQSPSGRALNIAYGFFKEGLNAKNSSAYYAFLSFYKVLQLAFGEGELGRRKTAEWIDIHIERACRREEELDRLKVRVAGKDSIGEYLYGSCRCAIAHTNFNRSTVVNPDDFDDRERIRLDLPIIQSLAAQAIQERAGELEGT